MKFFVFKYAVIALVVFGQSLALSHFPESGGDAHHHDGVVCSVALYDGHSLDSASSKCRHSSYAAIPTDVEPKLVRGTVRNAREFSPPPTGPPSI